MPTHFRSLAPRIPVADLRRSIRFYADLLGFREDVLWPADEPTFAMLARDGVSLGLHAASSRVEHAGPLPIDLYIEVDDALALHETLRDKVTIEWGPEVYSYGRREFAFRDPDGYLVIITQPTLDPPTCVVD